jgi:competence protein ComEC
MKIKLWQQWRYKPALYILFFLISGILFSKFLLAINQFKLLNLILTVQLLAVLIYFLFYLKISRNSVFIFLLLLAFFLGSFSFVADNYRYYAPQSISNFQSQAKVLVKARLEIDPGDLSGSNYYLKVKELNKHNFRYGKIIVSKRCFDNYHSGDLLSLYLKLSLPQKQLNPGGFSYRNFLKRKQIYLQGWQPTNIKFLAASFDYRKLIIKLKSKFLDKVDLLFQDKNQALIKAVVFGERSALDKKEKSLLRGAGASHLLAISGLHIGILVFALQQFILKFFKQSKKTLFSLSLCLVIYILMIGASAAVIRAASLALLYLWSVELKRDTDFLNLLAVTLIINLIFDPAAIFKVSLQLSYLLVLGLYLLTPFLNKFLPALLAVSAAAQLAAFAITIYYFNQYNYIAFLTNIWLIPLFSFLLPFLFIIILISFLNITLASLGAIFAAKLLNITFALLTLMVKLQGKPLLFKTPPLFLVVIYYCLLFYLPLTFRHYQINFSLKTQQLKQITVLTAFIISLLIFSYQNNSQLLKVTYLAVGQGDGIYVEFPNGEKMIIDTGPPGKDNMGIAYTIIPYLDHFGIKNIDYLVISHFDADHVGGMPYLLKNKQINNIFIPPFKKPAKYHVWLNNYLSTHQQPKLYKLTAGQQLQVGQCQLSILNPLINKISSDRNANSIVILVNYKNNSFLFTGDLPASQEKRIIREYKLKKINILKAGHHGSNTSSCAELLKNLRPDLTVISVGRNNFGHPAPEVLSRLNKYNLKYLRTDQNGAITVLSNGSQLKIKTFLREEKKSKLIGQALPELLKAFVF